MLVVLLWQNTHQEQLKDESLTSTHSWGICSIMMGKPWRHNLKTVGHRTPTIGKQRTMDSASLPFSFLFGLGPEPMK